MEYLKNKRFVAFSVIFVFTALSNFINYSLASAPNDQEKAFRCIKLHDPNIEPILRELEEKKAFTLVGDQFVISGVMSKYLESVLCSEDFPSGNSYSSCIDLRFDKRLRENCLKNIKTREACLKEPENLLVLEKIKNKRLDGATLNLLIPAYTQNISRRLKTPLIVKCVERGRARPQPQLEERQAISE